MEAAGREVLRGAVRGQWRDLTVASALASAHQVGETLVPVLIGVTIDRAVGAGDGRALLLWLGALAAVYLALSWGYRWGAYRGERAAARAARDLRTALVTRVLDPRGGAEDGRLPGALAGIATEDARRVGYVNVAIMAGAAALVAIGLGTVLLLRMSVPLGLVVLLGTPPLLWAGHLLSRPLERRSAAERERSAHASAVAADLARGLRVLKGIGAEGAAARRYRATSGGALAATLRATRAEAGQEGAVLALTGVFIAVVALVGGRLAAAGELTLGQLVAAVGLALLLLGPFSVLAWVNAQLAQGRASAARVGAVLAAPAAVQGGDAPLPQPVGGAVRLRGVTYGPLRGLDLDVPAGQIVGVVAGGADAAALLDLLGRTADPAEGDVELDGTPLRGLHPAAVRAAVLVAAHEADLFAGTVAADVAAAARGADTGPALRAAGADGLDGATGDGGGALSGGQRQRVALARALAADAPVLVLHDPTTAVDAVTEARVAAGVRALRAGRTTVLVATSPALLAITDRVVLVEDGRVAADSSHADLARGHDGYRTAVLS
ncbi:ABC transporter transmembrane domain-containing protein [Actinomadura parmotrematis]|uniref:ABC transporter ATP-binding protein/permease n=1 Tax=Actinomadura parmotrematis TaxID=2864039 RepID=A0ABS7FQ26_9ACTN|nr:ABC transporter ATP-binding protein [Actinomadura parmotrematis]MBW8482519.1 ABC transporter ATP-binding protein/permease [Actinomadura parmotrematis]